jgi:polyphosphate kinase 2 (PPK2 family)
LRVDADDGRFEDIRNHERYLARNGLHVSKKEQRKRLLERE